ncbi:MAG: flotillin-like FloA family protein [Puniceicoccales bacterium]|jgi:uncharacterized protein YqfA (UPF0365 family)|nr:flotillin-like FloA family protein [Puniceicoccales bacterium]
MTITPSVATIAAFHANFAASGDAAGFYWKLILGIVAGSLALLIFVIVISVAGAWIRALSARAGVGLTDLIGLLLRRAPVNAIVDARIAAIKARVFVGLEDLEAHHLAGGSVTLTARALITAANAGVPFEWGKSCALDLATRSAPKNVLDVVLDAVNPQVIDCVVSGNGADGAIEGVARDGIQVRVNVRVSVRTSLDRYIGGAREGTLIARVSEGVISAIGAAESHRVVLENPGQISKAILGSGIDAGTAFDVLSVDIVAASAGENVGARLQAEQAEAGKVSARAQAEIRRATAIAAEQEMRAKERRMRALRIESEAQVPLALADALRTGRLGAADIYRLENLKADTQMRLNLSLPEPETGKNNLLQ